MSDPAAAVVAAAAIGVDETVVDAEMAATAAAYLPVADGGALPVADGGANSKWSRNGFGATVPKQVGKFSKDESEEVRKAVEEYCSAKQISTARLCSECDHKAELKGSWMEIAKHLPHRSVQSVYRHGIRQLHPFKRGAWSEQETVTLSDLVTRLGKKWSAIQTKLNRSADSCRDKYREMSDDYVKGRWKEQEMEMLRRLVREHLNADETTDMKALGRMVEDQGIQIPWSNISKRIGKRSRLSCFKKWQKMAGLLSASEENRRRKGDDDDDDEHATAAAANIGNNSTNNNNNNMSNKRAKLEEATHVAATAGAAAAMAAAATDDYDEQVYNSVKMAEETVEAVDLPDVDVAATAHI